MKKHLALISLIVLSLSIYGQRLISGTVIDEESNEVIIGACIIVENTEIGTISDLDGNFSIVVSDSSYISFSFLGYLNKIISVQDLDNDTITVELEEYRKIISTAEF